MGAGVVGTDGSVVAGLFFASSARPPMIGNTTETRITTIQMTIQARIALTPGFRVEVGYMLVAMSLFVA
jgi:hypothetical protein